MCIFYSNRKALSLWPFVANLKKNLFQLGFYIYFLIILYMYIAPGQGRTIERPYHFDHLLQVLKKSLWSLILYIFCNVFMHVYSPRPGADNPWWQSFDVNRKPRPLWPFVASFKWSLCILILYTFFKLVIHVYSPGARADKPLGSKFLMSSESSYHFDHLLQV